MTRPLSPRHSAASLLAALSLIPSAGAQVEAFETQRFDPPTPGAIPGYFGSTLDSAGDVLVTGDREDSFPAGNGRAFVYTREGLGWSAGTELTASNGTLFDSFGNAVVTDGETVFVAAPLADAPGGAFGAVYTYTRQAGSWVEGTTIYAADPLDTFQFGVSLSIDGDVLAVGALAPPGSSVASGSVHVLERSAGVWTEVAKLTSPNPMNSDFFGFPLAVWADTLVTGAPGPPNTTLPTTPGEIVIYRRSAAGWSLEAQPTVAGLKLGDNFGLSVALRGDQLIVGAPQFSSAGPGRAFSFERTAAGWSEVSELSPASLGSDDGFGSFVELGSNLAVVSAYLSANGADSGGALHLFERSSDDWFETSVISPTDVQFGDQFGIDPTLAMGPTGPELFAGSAFAGSPPTGAFYSFRLRGTTLGSRLCAGSTPGLCPCGNTGAGTAGCAHTAAPGGRLSASGSLSVAQDDLRLLATDLPTGQPAVPFVSMAMQAPMPAGDGLLCLGGTPQAAGLAISGTAGKAGFGPGLGALTGWQVGETWTVQVAFRDSAFVCGSGLQWTSALALTLEP